MEKHELEDKLKSYTTSTIRPYPQTTKNNPQNFTNTTNNNPYIPKPQTQTQDFKSKRFLSKDEFEDRSKCYNCQGRGHMARECPNKRALTLNEFVAYEQEENLYDVMLKHQNEQGEENVEDVIDVYGEEDACDDEFGESKVGIMRMMHTNTVLGKELRTLLFRNRAKVDGRGCFVIVDSGSCTNVASKEMVT